MRWQYHWGRCSAKRESPARGRPGGTPLPPCPPLPRSPHGPRGGVKLREGVRVGAAGRWA
eukprot:14754449-Alexandrium_andersonii.AAC.1